MGKCMQKNSFEKNQDFLFQSGGPARRGGLEAGEGGDEGEEIGCI